MAQAHAAGRPVTVASATTQTSQTVANPGGTFTMTTHVLPVRVRSGGKWRPVSAALRRTPAGSWASVATPSGLTLSNGGARPLAVLTSPAGGRLSVSFPGRLPKPAISGATAIYRSVLPGVDLRLTATSIGGFNDVIVVHNAAAAARPDLRRLRLALSAGALHVTANRAGNLSAKGASGRLEFSGSAPVAWDSSTAARSRGALAAGSRYSSAAGPGAGARTVAASASLAGSGLTIAAPPGLLSASASYPVYIASSISPDVFTAKSDATESDAGSYTEVKAGCPGTTFWNNTEQFGNGAGNQDYGQSCGGVDRAYYQIDTSNLDSSMIVQKATFSGWENYGSDQGCNDPWPLTLHLTTGISSSTDWNSKPTTDSNDEPTSLDVKPGPNSGSNCSTQEAQYAVAYVVRDAIAGNWPVATIGLYGDESSSDDPLDGGSGACLGGDTATGAWGLSSAGYNCGFMRIGENPDIVTTFDLVPPVPTCNSDTNPNDCNTQTSPIPQDSPTGPDDFGCNASGSYGWINQTSNTFDVTLVSLITGEQVRAIYHMWDNQNNGDEVSSIPGPSAFFPSGSTTSTPVGFTLQNGHQYGWNAEADVDGTGAGSPNGSDGSNTVGYASAKSTFCYFNVDTSAPAGLTAASAQFPPSGTGQAGSLAGSAGTFTFSAADPVPAGCTPAPCLTSGVARFAYSLNGGPTAYSAASANSGGSAATGSASLTVGNWGTNILEVQAEDKAGNLSQPVYYTFYAPWNPSALVTPGDVNGNGIPDLLATTSAGLELYPGNTDPSITPVTAGSTASSPDGTAWNTFQIAHRGSMSQGAVDDLFAHKGNNLYLYLNNPSSLGAAPQFNTIASLRTIASHPACAATADNAANCTSYTAGNWSDVTQILAPGDAWAGSGSDNGQPSLLTVENGALWLYQGLFNDALGSPIQLGSSSGTTNWSAMTLIAPGTVNGLTTIWARNNATGAISSYPITIDANQLPTLNASSPGTPVTATSGTVITGITLPSSTYPAVASPGPLDNSSFPGLYAETTTGTTASGASCASGCLSYYPGQATTGGSQPLNPHPLFVGVLNKSASQLS
jgi:hypothetical protein